MKKIKLIGLFVCILLIYLIFYGVQDNEINDEDNQIVQLNKENVNNVINNGGSILYYNGYEYYINKVNSIKNGFSNKLCRRKLNGGREEVLFNAEQTKIEDRLIIFNNNIFFSMTGQTYYINLENTSYMAIYNEGILYTIGDGKIIYANKSDIYKGTYYANTLAIKDITKIASAKSNFMFEDEENLYFYSTNTDKSISIIKVDKEKQVAYFLDRIYSDEKKKLEILKFNLSEENIYVFFKNVENGDVYQLRKISKDGSKINSIGLSNEIENMYTLNDEIYFTLNYDTKLYLYDEEKNEKVEVEIPKNPPDIYNLKLVGNNVELYNNNELVSTILRGVENKITNVKIEEIDEYLYFKFDLVNSEDENIVEEFMYWRINKDGNNLVRINNN